MTHLTGPRTAAARWTALIAALFCLVFALGWARAEAAVRASDEPVKPCPYPAAISNIVVSNVSATSAALSWNTDAAVTTCLDLDSSLLPPAGAPAPGGKFRGITYAPGGYLGDLYWLNSNTIAAIKADVQKAAQAFFDVILLYAVGPDASRSVHDYDRAVFEQAADSGMKIAFRLEWYPAGFSWSRADCDAVVDHYRPYFQYFNDHTGLLQYYLLNNPLDDTRINNPMPSIQKQRDYVAYCYSEIKKLAPTAPVYANTYFGWRDELPQAPVADLVDGVSLVIYAQHQTGAPYDCSGTPAASDPLSRLICKDQFDYYIERSYADNLPGIAQKPLVLDATGFAQAASFKSPEQKNGIVADSAAKAQAIYALRRYAEGHPRLAGWSYFMLLPSQEAHWGLIDRRRIVEETPSLAHQRVLTDLLPGQSYTVTLRAGEQMQQVTFTASAITGRADPLLTIDQPVNGTLAVFPGGQARIAWRIQDLAGSGATLRLFYDTDDRGCDGQAISGALPANAPAGDFYWTVPQMTGMFYIYGVLDDGVHPPACDYSPGQVVTSPMIKISRQNFTTQPITLDGRLDEIIWNASPARYADHAAQPDRSSATISPVWDETYLYLGFTVADEQVEEADSASPWNDDSVSAVFFNGRINCRQGARGEGTGACARALSLIAGTTLNDNSNKDTGYTVEMRIPWSELHTTPMLGQHLPVDFLSVDHDGSPRAAYDGEGVKFSKLSWDGDGSVDTTGRTLWLLGPIRFDLPVIMKFFAP